MREGWVIKTLGDLFDIGSSKRVYESQWRDSGVPFYRAREIVKLSRDGYVDNDLFIDEDLYEEYANRYSIPKCGDIMVTGVGTLGICYIVKEGDRFYFKDGNILWFKSKEGTNPYYVNYAFKSNYLRQQIENCNGATVGTFTIVRAKSTTIPVPPLPEQERIVAELDLLSGIIEKKKEQLKAYDQLAQSIFYTMFGDPIDNPQGWEVKKLKDVSTLINGRAYKQNELLSEGKYKVLRVGNFFTNSNFYYSDLELEDNKYCDNGDLLFAWSASFGAFIWNGGKVIFHYHIWKVLYDEQQLNKIFYRFLLNTMTNAFMNDVHGIGMVHLTKQGMEEYNIPVPPLSLQQEFAEKVEAIERQKALVQQSIEETQTMFDYTMDKYFG